MSQLHDRGFRDTLLISTTGYTSLIALDIEERVWTSLAARSLRQHQHIIRHTKNN
jgi:hypothetical protein